MALSNAERQARHRERRDALIASLQARVHALEATIDKQARELAGRAAQLAQGIGAANPPRAMAPPPPPRAETLDYGVIWAAPKPEEQAPTPSLVRKAKRLKPPVLVNGKRHERKPHQLG